MISHPDNAISMKQKPFSFLTASLLLFWFLLATLMLTVSSIPLKGQAEIQTETIGKWREGTCNAVYQDNNTVWYNNGCFLEIGVINSSQMLEPVSRLETRGKIYDLLVKDNLAFLAIEEFGLSIIDVSDIAHPVELSFYPLSWYYPQIVWHNSMIWYFSGSGTGGKAIDVSDPVNPVFKKDLLLSSVNNAVIHGNYLFAACRWDGFKVYDLSDLDDIELVYSDDNHYYYDMDIRTNVACILRSDSLFFMDFSDPFHPTLLSKLKAGSITSCTLAGNRVFAAGWSLMDIDISDPSNPVVFSDSSLLAKALNLFVSDKQLSIAADPGKLIRYEIKEPNSLALIEEIPTPGISFSIAYYQDIVFLSHATPGMSILDVSDPENPVQVKVIPMASEILCLKTLDHYLLVSDQGLRILDISDPLNPVEVSYLGIEDYTYKFQIAGSFVYMTAGSKGLYIFDISDLQNPVLLGQSDTPGNAFDLDVHADENLVYVADWNKGMRIIDVTNPTSPFETGSVDIPSITPLKTVKVQGHTAWVGSTNFGIRVLDFSDLSNPVLTEYLNTARGYDIQIRYPFAFVSAGYVGLYVFDIHHFEQPEKIALYESPGEIRHIALTDKLIFCADYECGMSIFRFDPCELLSLETEINDISCHGMCDGKIQIMDVDHAMLPLLFAWSNGANESLLDQLCPGEYSLTVTDQNSCSLSDTFFLSEPFELLLDALIVTHITPSNPNGSVSYSVTGGSPPYTYHWTGPEGFETNQPNPGYLAAGCYALTVTDSHGCPLTVNDICIEDQSTAIPGDVIDLAFRIFPNPADTYVRFLTTEVQADELSATRAEILSPFGQLVKRCKNLSSGSVDISDLPEGMYIVRWWAGGHVHQDRFIVKRK